MWGCEVFKDREVKMAEDWLANAYEGMSRRQFLARMTAAGIGLAGYAVASNSVAGEIITTLTSGLTVADSKVSSGGFSVPVYEAHPSASGKYPIVLVIPEVFGMHEHIRDVVRRFAKQGYFAITFEPYAREGGVLHLSDMTEVQKVVNAVPDAQVMGDLDAIVTYAKQQVAARADRIGVTGFCRGGLYTLLYAAHSKEIKAAVAWYGQIKPARSPGVRTAGPLDIVSQINAPLLGLYGEEDLGIPVADVKEMETALKAAGKTAEFVVYPGAPHAFFADYRPSYRVDAATDAWGRCVAWFNKYLKR
jgi:carboxymethylenebutenolidase